MSDYVDPVDFGAVGDWNGTSGTDDSAAFQAALDALSACPRGGVLAPQSRRYRLTRQLTYSGKPLRISGDGEDLSQFVWTAPGGLLFNGGALAVEMCNKLIIGGVSFHSQGVNNAGNAIDARWDAHDNVVSRNLLIEDVKITQSNGYWSKGAVFQNAGEGKVDGLYAMMFGQSTDNCLEFNNSLTMSSYGMRITNCDINGGKKGIYLKGQQESFYISKSAVVGALSTLEADSTGTSSGSAALHISDCHLNGMTTSLKTTGWRSIYVNNSDLYAGVGQGWDTDGDIVQINHAKWFTITGCKIENGRTDLSKRGVNVNSDGAVITGNQIINATNSGIVLVGGSTRDVTISGNTLQGTGQATGVWVDQITGNVTVTGNTIRNFPTAASVQAPNMEFDGNTVVDCATGVWSNRANVKAGKNTFVNVPTPISGSVTWA